MNGPVHLAEEVLRYVQAAGVIDISLLHESPIQALRADPSIDLTFVPRPSLPLDCSIAACYLRSPNRSRILVADDASPGRRAFSALHEYCHHLRDQVDSFVDALWTAPDGGRRLEEQVCDAFAARILAPPAKVAAVLGGGVTASGVLRLFNELPASREACAVAAARAMTSAGYVMLLDSEGNAIFTARSGDVFPVRRGTPQDSTLLSAVLMSGSRSGTGRVSYHSGVQSAEFLLDVSYGEPYRVAVWAEHSPGWGGLTIGLATDTTRNAGYCENCRTDFESFAPLCAGCDESRCPTCGRCACASPPPTAGARVCEKCCLELPARCFSSQEQSLCVDCL
jgi:hypothetical protein